MTTHALGLLGPWCGKRSARYAALPSCSTCARLGGTEAPPALTKSDAAALRSRSVRWSAYLSEWRRPRDRERLENAREAAGQCVRCRRGTERGRLCWWCERRGTSRD